MLIFIRKDGSIQFSEPQNINQGSVKVNNISIVAPFSTTSVAKISFEKPDGVLIQDRILTATSLNSADGTNLFTYLFDEDVVDKFGTLKWTATFTDIDGGILASSLGSIQVDETVIPADKTQTDLDDFDYLIARINEVNAKKREEVDAKNIPADIQYSANGIKTDAFYRQAEFTINNQGQFGYLQVSTYALTGADSGKFRQSERLYNSDQAFRRNIEHDGTNVLSVEDWVLVDDIGGLADLGITDFFDISGVTTQKTSVQIPSIDPDLNANQVYTCIARYKTSQALDGNYIKYRGNVLSDAERDAEFPTPNTGDYIIREDTQIMQYFDGSVWVDGTTIETNLNRWQWETETGQDDDQYTWYDTLVQVGVPTQLTQDVEDLKINKSDKSDTGLFAEIDPSLKDTGQTNIAQAINRLKEINDLGQDADSSTFQKIGEYGLTKNDPGFSNAKVSSKAYADENGNIITSTYTTKVESNLKQDKTDNTLTTTNKTVSGAINELNTDVGNLDSRIDGNDSDIADNTIAIQSNSSRITTNENDIATKIDGLLIKDSEIPVQSGVQSINFDQNLQVDMINSTEVRVTAVNTGITVKAEIDGADTPNFAIPVGTSSKINTQTKIASNDSNVLEIVSGDMVLKQESGYTFNLSATARNTNSIDPQATSIEVYLNGILGDTIDFGIGEEAGEDTIVNPSPSTTLTKDQILGITAFPVTVTYNIVTDNTGAFLDRFEVETITVAIDGEGTGFMFKSDYDKDSNGRVDNADYDGTGTNYLTGNTDTQSAITTLDTTVNTNEENISTNTGDISSNTSNIDDLQNNKQEVTPGDLDTTAVTTSGAINENYNKTRKNELDIDVLSETTDGHESRIEKLEDTFLKEDSINIALASPTLVSDGQMVLRPDFVEVSPPSDPSIYNYDVNAEEFIVTVPGSTDTIHTIGYTTSSGAGRQRDLLIDFYKYVDGVSDILIDTIELNLPKSTTSTEVVPNGNLIAEPSTVYIVYRAVGGDITINSHTIQSEYAHESGINGAQVSYDNTGTILTATNTQDAIAENAEYNAQQFATGMFGAYILDNINKTAVSNMKYNISFSSALGGAELVTISTDGGVTADPLLDQLGGNQLKNDAVDGKMIECYFNGTQWISEFAPLAGDVKTKNGESISNQYIQATSDVILGSGASIGVSGIDSVAIGSSSTSSEFNTVAIGSMSSATASGDTSIGDSANSSGGNSIAIGTLSKATDRNAVAIGSATEANGKNSASFGSSAKTSLENTIQLGNNTKEITIFSGDKELAKTTKTVGFDINTAVDNGVIFSTSRTGGISFNNTGSLLYATGGTDIEEFSLSAEFDISTAVSTGKVFDASAQNSNIRGFAFNNDGSAMYTLDETSLKIYQYSLSKNFDISTATYSNKSFGISGIDTDPCCLKFNNSGSKLYFNGRDNGNIYELDLSTNFDVSTAFYGGTKIDYSVLVSAISIGGFTFNNDGSNIYLSESDLSDPDRTYEIKLSKSFDLSTASYNGKNFDFGISGVFDMAFNNDGSKLYELNFFGVLYEYDLSSQEYNVLYENNYEIKTYTSLNAIGLDDTNDMSPTDLAGNMEKIFNHLVPFGEMSLAIFSLYPNLKASIQTEISGWDGNGRFFAGSDTTNPCIVKLVKNNTLTEHTGSYDNSWRGFKQAPGSITISGNDPSGGNDGDLWFKF